MNDDDERTCGLCGGPLVPLGQLGRLTWYRCRHCGMQFHCEEPINEQDE